MSLCGLCVVLLTPFAWLADVTSSLSPFPDGGLCRFYRRVHEASMSADVCVVDTAVVTERTMTLDDFSSDPFGETRSVCPDCGLNDRRPF